MTTMFMFFDISVVVAVLVLALVLLLMMGPMLFGAVLISERQVGIVVKRFAQNSLLPGHLVALNGEAGFQAAVAGPQPWSREPSRRSRRPATAARAGPRSRHIR